MSLLLVGCSSGELRPAGSDAKAPSDGRSAVRGPLADAVFDYQLGGAYRPSSRVRVISRDRVAEPLPGAYNLCHVNAFQSQPGAAAARWWRRNHPELLLRDDRGELVVDEEWSEPLFGISTKSRRAALAAVVGRGIDGCAEAGFDAVEPDNLDSFERSGSCRRPATPLRSLAWWPPVPTVPGLPSPRRSLPNCRTRAGASVSTSRSRRSAPATGSAPSTRRSTEAGSSTWSTGGRTSRRGRALGEELSVTLRDRGVLPVGSAGHVYRHW
jgi:hypothetical protein